MTLFKEKMTPHLESTHYHPWLTIFVQRWPCTIHPNFEFFQVSWKDCCNLFTIDDQFPLTSLISFIRFILLLIHFVLDMLVLVIAWFMLHSVTPLFCGVFFKFSITYYCYNLFYTCTQTFTNCHHFPPKNSSPRENIMVQENVNIDTYPWNTKPSLGEDNKMTLESPSLTSHANKGKILEVMTTQVGYPLISELPKSPPTSESHKKLRDLLKFMMQSVDGCFCTISQHMQYTNSLPILKGNLQRQVAENLPKVSRVVGDDLHGTPQLILMWFCW